MEKLADFFAPIWVFLNHPFIILGKSSITLWTILFNLFFILGFIFVTAKIKKWMIQALSRISGINVSNWRAAITLSYYAFLGIGLVGILQSTGLDLSLFTVLTGAIGIGVGFGMQSIFSNFISGIIILLEKPLSLGDRIEVGGVSGNVKSISVRATTIVTNDNVSIIVPNSDFISKQVINWSHSGNYVRLSIQVSVAYDSDFDVVSKLLLEIADNEPGVLKQPAPAVQLAEFGDSALKFSLLVWTREYTDRKGVLRSLLNFRILKLFRENKIHVPFPQRDIHIHNVPPPEKTEV
jgi:small-conductance mechanosensitive channel